MVEGGALLTGLLSSLFFIVLNVSMNIYMKWLFRSDGGDFPLPWTINAFQQAQSFILLQPILLWMKKKGYDRFSARKKGDPDEEPVSCTHLFQVYAVTLLFCLNVGTNSLSLVRISITLNQTVRAFLPVGVLLLATVLEQRTYPSHSYVTTGMLVIGIALSCWGSPQFDNYGFCLAFVSTLVAALGTSLNGRLLSQGPFSKSGPYGIARLIMIQSMPAFFTFSIIAIATEGTQVREKLEKEWTGEGRWQVYQTIGLVSISGALALLSNLGRCFLVAATSALMETLAGNAKVAALCIIDHYLFGTALYWHNYLGITITFFGFSVHLLLQYAISEPEPEKRTRKETRRDSQVDGEPEIDGTRPRPNRKGLNRPRLISAAETGLAAEHMAVELGRDTMKLRTFSQESTHSNGNGSTTVPALPRPRSVTWPPIAQAEPRSMWTGVDFSLVLELPPWLSSAGQPGSPEDYSPLSVTSLSPAARFQVVSPALGSMSPVASSARSRFFTDPTDANNNKSRLLEDVRQGPQPLSSVREEEMDPESQSPPDLGYL